MKVKKKKKRNVRLPLTCREFWVLRFCRALLSLSKKCYTFPLLLQVPDEFSDFPCSDVHQYMRISLKNHVHMCNLCQQRFNICVISFFFMSFSLLLGIYRHIKCVSRRYFLLHLSIKHLLLVYGPSKTVSALRGK